MRYFSTEESAPIEEKLRQLHDKGFRFGEEVREFLYFGKLSTNATDNQVLIAFTWTVKLQGTFDGSFYVNLLEQFVQGETQSEEQAFLFMQTHHLVQTEILQ